MPIKRSALSIRPAKILLLIGVLLAIVIVVALFSLRRYIFNPVLNIESGKTELLYIPTGADYDDVLLLLNSKNLLSDEQAFNMMASLMGYKSHVKSGCYELKPSMSARGLVQILRSGSQKPVKVTFNNVRTLESLAGQVSKYIESDSSSILNAMRNSDTLEGWGLSLNEAPSIYLPDSYELWWNVTPSSFVERMHDEYLRFWNDTRLAKADSLSLSPIQVSILASIVEEESNKSDDQRKIASVYLNRLRIGMPLQACPTVKFALGNFSLRRITNADTQVDSPYNTYVHQGLPPGPIRIPSKKVIDAVLKADDTDYLFFCARPDGSGMHDFARTLAQHQRNANRYHNLLNKRKIYR